MSNFAVWKDVVYTANVQDLRYYVKADGETIYQGRAKADPSGTVRINVRNIVKDWLDSNIRDYLPMSPDFVAHPEALRVFGLYNADNDVLLAEYNVLFNFDSDWNGEDMLLQNPVNTHADPRQKIFAGYGTIDPDGADVDITVRDLYWFDADSLVNVAWNAGEANVPVNTNYPLSLISVVVPAGVRLRKMHQTYFEFEVPVNFLNASQSYNVEYWKGGVMIDQTEIRVAACSAYFTCPNSITVGGDGTYFDIAFSTDIPLEYIGVEPGSGLRLVVLSEGKVRLYAEPNTSLNPFSTGVSFINTATGNQVGYTYVTVSAPTVYFFVDPVYYMDCDGGTLTIPVTTSYDMSQVAVQTPGAVTVLSKTQNGITVRVDANTSTTDVAVHNIVFRYGAVIGTTRIEVDVFTYHFSTAGSVPYNPYDEENVRIPWNTNIPINAIGITLPPGSTLVSRDATGITITHPSADGNVTFTFNGGLLGTVTVYSLAEDYFTCVALTSGYLPWTSEFEVKINGGNWQTLNPTGETGTLLQAGDVAFVRGNVDSPLFNSADNLWPDTHSTDSAITSNLCDFDAYGNILSMLYGDSYETATGYTGNKSLAGALSNTRVKDASGVILPAFTKNGSEAGLFDSSSVTVPPIIPYVSVIEESAYDSMFLHCTDLQFAPEINAGTIGIAGCRSMFFGCTGLTSAGRINVNTVDHEACLWMYYECTSLVVAPDMSTITTIVDTSNTTPGNHFRSMFEKCTSLTTPPSVLNPLTTFGDSYCEMFKDCTSLLSAPEIEATTMSSYCCANMFNGCTALRTPPSILKAVTLQRNCYGGMFEGCVSLLSAPVVNATTLADECCKRMFYGCRSLATAPDLLAQLSSTHCYEEMFYGCTSLNYIKCMLQQRYSINGDIRNWIAGVSATGTFVKRQGTDWETGVSNTGIPSGWTVQEV